MAVDTKLSLGGNQKSCVAALMSAMAVRALLGGGMRMTSAETLFDFAVTGAAQLRLGSSQNGRGRRCVRSVTFQAHALARRLVD